MATQNTASVPRAQPVAQPPVGAQALPVALGTPVASQSPISPPSKRELVSWWKKFRKNNEKSDEKTEALRSIFGVPLAESIRYANVAISLQDDRGESFIYGYVPIVVAKCGVFLKEKAVDVEGIFRLSGSAKRIKDLQAIFNSPDRYGKGLDWTGYTVHDAANILRRYLNQLPEPIVPLEFYDRFRDPIRSHQTQAVGDKEAQANDVGNFDFDDAVSTYQKLITELPPLNRQLLLYILDLLAVFSSKSDLNRMNSANLAAIFQPGIISHPNHDMNPNEYRLSQDVLIFLIENQDNFLIGLPGTAADEKTVQDVESGPPPIPSPKPALGRSASNASAGADSLRKYGVRRNMSVSSRGSRDRSSNGIPSPGTAGTGGPFPSGSPGGGGLGRSNTVPSKKSPAVPSGRFHRHAEHSGPTSPALNESDLDPSASTDGATLSQQPLANQGQTADEQAVTDAGVGAVDQQPASLENTGQRPETPSTLPAVPVQAPLAVQTATRERKISNLFSRSPLAGPVDAAAKDLRPPKRLQKRQKLPGSRNESAQSSQNSLHGDLTPGGHTPLGSPEISSATRSDPMAAINSSLATSAALSPGEVPIGVQHRVPFAPQDASVHGNALQVPKSPENSLHSRSSVTDASDFDTLDDGTVKVEKAEKRRRRWRFPSAKKNSDTPLVPPPPIGQLGGTRSSTSSAGSANRPNKSITSDSQLTQAIGTDSSMGYPSVHPQSSQESSEPSRENAIEQEKKGLFGKLKAKMSQAKEEKKERDAEKERAKSPPRSTPDHGASRSSLAAIAQERLVPRGRSIDKQRDEAKPVTTDAPISPKTTAEGVQMTLVVESEAMLAAPAETKPSEET